MLDIPSQRAMEQHILDTYYRSTDADFVSGMNWYATARDIARDIADGDVSRGAGVIAAFSPMMAWKTNIENARKAIETKDFVGSFQHNNRKAEAIWCGDEPLDVLGGDKVRAFHHCIVSGGQTNSVCVDRHAGAIALGPA